MHPRRGCPSATSASSTTSTPTRSRPTTWPTAATAMPAPGSRWRRWRRCSSSNARAYVVALTASLLVALTVTPVLCSLLLRRVRSDGEHHDSRLVAALKRRYRPVLRAAVRGWRAVMALALAGLIAAIIAAASLGRAFLPEFHEGTLTVSAVTLPGTSLTQSNQLGAWIERILLARPEVTSVARRTGRAELDEHAQGVNAAELDVNLAPDLPDREAFLAELRDDLGAVPGTFIVLGQPISHRIDHMLSGTRAARAVRGRARQRDPGADGPRHPLRPRILDRPQYVRGTRPVCPLPPRGRAGALSTAIALQRLGAVSSRSRCRRTAAPRAAPGSPRCRRCRPSQARSPR
jgi:hypothetical protein